MNRRNEQTLQLFEFKVQTKLIWQELWFRYFTQEISLDTSVLVLDHSFNRHNNGSNISLLDKRQGRRAITFSLFHKIPELDSRIICYHLSTQNSNDPIVYQVSWDFKVYNLLWADRHSYKMFQTYWVWWFSNVKNDSDHSISVISVIFMWFPCKHDIHKHSEYCNSLALLPTYIWYRKLLSICAWVHILSPSSQCLHERGCRFKRKTADDAEKLWKNCSSSYGTTQWTKRGFHCPHIAWK